MTKFFRHLRQQFIMENKASKYFKVDYEELLSEEMKFILLKDAVTYISSNSRQIELYNFIQKENDITKKLLEKKCAITND